MALGMKKVFSIVFVSFLFFAGSDIALSLSWQVETVDWYGDAGIAPSLALDSSGNPHIAYAVEYPGYFGELRYATRDEIGWHSTSLPGCRCGAGLSIAMDSGDEPKILATSGSTLHWCGRDGATWYGVDTGTLNNRSDVCLRFNDYTPAATSADYYRSLAYTEKIGDAWEQTVIQTRASGDEWGLVSGVSKDSLAFDSDGRPHVTYGWDRSLRHAHREENTWIIESIPPAAGDESPFYDAAILLDGEDVPHIFAVNGFSGELGHFFKNSGSWEEEVIDTQLCEKPSLAFNESGQLVVAYSKAGPPVVDNPTVPSVYHPRIATLTEGGWEYEDIDTSGIDCREVSVEFGGGKTHLLFRNASGGNLMYAAGAEAAGALGGQDSGNDRMAGTAENPPLSEGVSGAANHFFVVSELADDGLTPNYRGVGLVESSYGMGDRYDYIDEDGEAFKVLLQHRGPLEFSTANVNAFSHGRDDIAAWLGAEPWQKLLRFSAGSDSPRCGRNDIVAAGGEGNVFIEHAAEDFGIDDQSYSQINNLAAYDRCSDVSPSVPVLQYQGEDGYSSWKRVNQSGNDAYISFGWYYDDGIYAFEQHIGAHKAPAISVDDGYVHPGDIIYVDRDFHIPEDPDDPFYREPYEGEHSYMNKNFNVMDGYLRGWKFVDARTLALALGLDDTVRDPINDLTQADIFLDYVMDIDALAAQDLDKDGVFDVGEDYVLFSLVGDCVKRSIYRGRGASSADAFVEEVDFTGEFFDGTTIFLYDGLSATTFFHIDRWHTQFYGSPSSTPPSPAIFFGEAISTILGATAWGDPYLWEIDALDIGIIPEPATMMLLIGGCAAATAGLIRRKIRG